MLFVEYLFDSLHAITHDTPFQHMVSTIEKELMIGEWAAFHTLRFELIRVFSGLHCIYLQINHQRLPRHAL